MAASYAMSAMRRMTSEFPGLPWEAFLCCADHSQGRLEVVQKVSDTIMSRDCHCYVFNLPFVPAESLIDFPSPYRIMLMTLIPIRTVAMAILAFVHHTVPCRVNLCRLLSGASSTYIVLFLFS